MQAVRSGSSILCCAHPRIESVTKDRIRALVSNGLNWSEVVLITMNGNVVPCSNDFFEAEVVGNVSTHSLREVWCSQRAENFRRALSNGDRTASNPQRRFVRELQVGHRMPRRVPQGCKGAASKQLSVQNGESENS